MLMALSVGMIAEEPKLKLAAPQSRKLYNSFSVASVGVPLTRERLLALPDDVRLLSNRCAYPPNPDLEGKIAHGTSREALWRAIVDGGLEGRTFEVVPDDRSLQYVKEEFRRAFNQCRPAKA